MRVSVDQEKCISVGNCVRVAPEVFGQREEDGVAIVLDEEPGQPSQESLREAVQGCPVHAIKLRSVARK
jgi:ferredoxin